jgi:hypothetical protein
LKMHVSEMMPKMKEPCENVKVRKVGWSETTESRNWTRIANARLQAVKKMKNIGKLTNCLLWCQGNAKKGLDDQKIDMALTLKKIRANQIRIIEKRVITLSRTKGVTDNRFTNVALMKDRGRHQDGAVQVCRGVQSHELQVIADQLYIPLAILPDLSWSMGTVSGQQSVLWYIRFLPATRSRNCS